MLTGVVDEHGATGNAAAIPGYSVAGKTGTAQKPGARRLLDRQVRRVVRRHGAGREAAARGARDGRRAARLDLRRRRRGAGVRADREVRPAVPGRAARLAESTRSPCSLVPGTVARLPPMHLDRLIAALGPIEVANAAPLEIARARLRHPRRRGRARSSSASAEIVSTGTSSRPRPSGRRGRARRRAAARRAGAAARRRRASRAAMPMAAAAFFGDPSRELDVAGFTGTNGKTTSAFLLQAILDAAGRQPALLTNIERRIGGGLRADRAEHAGGDRPAAPLPRDARRRRPLVRDGGDVDRAAQGPPGRHALRRPRLHEPDAGPPRLPRLDGGVLRREARALRRRPSAPSSTSATSGAARLAAELPDARTFDAGRRRSATSI